MFLGCSLVVSSLPVLSFPPSCPRAPQRSRHRASWRPAVTGCTTPTAAGIHTVVSLRQRDSPGRIRTLQPERGCPQPQHVSRVLRLGTTESHCLGGAAAAEDSRAPTESRRLRAVAAPRCARFAPPSFHHLVGEQTGPGPLDRKST